VQSSVAPAVVVVIVVVVWRVRGYVPARPLLPVTATAGPRPIAGETPSREPTSREGTCRP
jgi:hypothetical protein